jgi:hypothetical protein
MLLLLRNIVAACVIAAAVMAWWYPEPVLLRGELVRWGKLYEDRNTPPGRMSGAMGLGKAFVQSVSEPLPLTEFIAAKTRGRTVTVTGPAWAQAFGELEQGLAAGRRPVRFDRPDLRPFDELPGPSGYAEFRDAGGIRHMDYRRIPAREYETSDVPDEAAFPLRRHWPWLLGAGLTALAFGLFAGRAGDVVASSSAGRGVRWSAVCGVMFGALVLWPFVFDTVGSGASYASIVIGGLFLFGALVGMWLFGRQAGLLRDMVEGGRYLAHFTFEPEEWKAFARWEYGEETAQKRGVWLLIFGISVVVGAGLMIVKRDEASVVVFGFLMAFMALLLLLATGLPALTYRRNLRRPGEVYVGERCVYVNGTVHSWGTLGSRLDSVKRERKPLPHIRLVYSYIMVAGRSLYFFRNYVTVRIPVPSSQADGGDMIVKALEKSAHGG